MRIVLLGPPASGKGSIAERLNKKFGIPWISAGELLRQAARKDPYINRIISSGRLVPDNIVNNLVMEHIKNKSSFVLDGYPRSVEQARFLETITSIDLVLFIDVDRSISKTRIVYRRQCPKCGAIYNLKTMPPKNDETCDFCGTKLVQRKDDREEVWLDRWNLYEKETIPVINYYKNKEILRTIDGNRNIDEVFNEVLEILGL